MLLSGEELRGVFRRLNPFDEHGALRPEQERLTVLAANANMPVEIFGRAIVMAAAHGEGSPVIIQMSYNALKMTGGASDTYGPIAGVRRAEEPDPLVSGAMIAAYLIREFTEHYGAKCVALSLDHFKVPAFKPGPISPRRSRRAARALLEDALEIARPVLPELAKADPALLEEYTDYLCQEEYAAFKRDFLNVVQAVSPAWGMIDTERLPPLLDYVVTKEISDAIRQDLGNYGMMLEAEYGATGQSGAARQYQAIRGDELQSFADEVANFVEYTGADGIAYPIGMEHAAKRDEVHDPDVERLLLVQSRIYQKTGRYVPFAQHGGTGASFLARGLVGKNNVNTLFLVTGAAKFAGWVTQYREGIEAGDKRVGGTDMYMEATRGIAEVCLEKLREAGTYGMATQCLTRL